MEKLNYDNLIDLIISINNSMDDELENLYLYKKSVDDQENKISELFMHKILFFIYGGFYKNFQKDLFEPNFEAWKYGPVEIDYRKEFKKNNEPNFQKFNLNKLKLNNEEKKYLKTTLSNLLKNSPWNLVSISHDTIAWKNRYSPDSNNKIFKEDIIESFKNILI
ncbi:MAG: DUF4065 domain-containing protein [Malacoplasma sp.]|nr:DUF4065 domain-containing protein [Malacoplasma sp.]